MRGRPTERGPPLVLRVPGREAVMRRPGPGRPGRLVLRVSRQTRPRLPPCPPGQSGCVGHGDGLDQTTHGRARRELVSNRRAAARWSSVSPRAGVRAPRASPCGVWVGLLSLGPGPRSPVLRFGGRARCLGTRPLRALRSGRAGTSGPGLPSKLELASR
jgi:hypothetical protein